MKESRRFIEFTEPESLHCTHYFFKAWKNDGPILRQDLVKPGHSITKLFTTIRDVLPETVPQTIEIRSGLSGGWVVFSEGVAVGKSIQVRQRLISALNGQLLDALDIRSMPWYTNPEKFHEVHVTLGWIKRPPPQGIDAFRKQVNNLEFEPVSITLKSATLVHAKRSSLEFPQEGMVSFDFGRELSVDEDEFFSKLHL